MNIRKFGMQIAFSALMVLLMLPVKHAVAQGQGSLQITLPANIQNAQTIDLKALAQAVAGGTASEKLFDLTLSNTAFTEVNNLRVSLTVSSSNGEPLVTVLQNRPGFSMDAGQTVRATSNTILNGIPGIEESFDFDASGIDDILTGAGQDYMTKTKGIIKNDLITIRIEILDDNNRVWASGQAVLGAGSTSAPVRDFYLRSPGDVEGSDAEFGSKYPQFSWDGPSNTTYRLVVVREAEGNSAEALLENAFSSLPTIEKGIITNAGELNNEEMVDATVEKTSFDYPPNGVQQLQDGETYYWQVETTITGNNTTETVRSEIWEFTIKGASRERTEMSEEVQSAISSIIGESALSTLKENGYIIQSIELGGTPYTSDAVIIQELNGFSQKLQEGKISINN